MRIDSLKALLAFGLLLGGCMPMSENAVRKVVSEPEVVAVQPGQLPAAQAADKPAYRPGNPRLDAQSNRILRDYGTSLRDHARRYRLDYRLILAVMKQESGFYEGAVSEKGAQGLMQIMPETGLEVAEALQLEDVTRPHDNIQGGIYYLSRLYRMFEGVPEDDRIRLSLAAYNAGIGRVYDAQQIAAYLQENPTEWQSIRDALPLLSKRYYTLHKSIFPKEKPSTGWFGDSGQTVTYVENIMAYYDRYKEVLQ